MTSSQTDPRPEIERRHARWKDAGEALARAEQRLSNLRLIVFAVGMLLTIWVLRSHPTYWATLTLPVGVFLVLVQRHAKSRQDARLAAARCAFYARALARLDGSWSGSGPTGERYLSDEKLFARDIDLFGRGSLFQMLSTPRTRPGLDTLASWLKNPAPVDVITGRQGAVAELAADLDLREALAVVGAEAADELDPRGLVDWSRQSSGVARPGLVRTLSWVLCAGGLIAVGGWAAGLLGLRLLGIVVILDLIFLQWLRGDLARLYKDLLSVDRGLTLLAELLALVEARSWQSPRLAALRDSLNQEGHPPSELIGRLDKLVERIMAGKHNPYFGPVAFLTQSQVRTALALESWRTDAGTGISDWLDAVGQVEALAALANHAAENPTHVYPTVSEGPPRFRATGLGHVLLAPDQCVRNDVSLDGDMRLLLLSGSNMSGKSTLLRAVGTNLVLAMAGGPVRATSLELTPFALGASIRIVDSLQDGTSHFYAEIQRLRAIDDLLAGDWPVLYLLDEVLHGTNSSDRLVGAKAVVSKFVERGALGIVTTHDLALARIAEDFGGLATNAHFEDSMDDGKMAFDYQLRPGVVERGNALALMRSLGLEV